MSIIRHTIISALAANIPFAANAQYNEIKSERIASVQVVAGNNWLSMPITKLHGGEPINIGFDDLTHEYHRYAYRLEHCEADWTTSENVFDSDFCEGFADGNTIDDAEESINTNTLYTHYRLTIPNDKCRPKISGNYRLTIYDENEDNIVLTVCFMVVDPQVNISITATTNTDIDVNRNHQQVAMNIGYNALRITNTEKEIKTIVMQNGNWHDARRNIQPQYTNTDGMRWDHNRNLIFNGGNEFRKFEILDVTHPTLGIENVWWDGSEYNAQIWTDMPRLNYIYDEDANGSFYIRNSDNMENDISSEYVLVHFRLKTPRLPNNVYLSGVWTNGELTPKYLMTYNEITKVYEAAIKLKQGYYSYQYVTIDDRGKPEIVPSEGNFFQTENNYQALVYYRGIGQRTDLLVGYRDLKVK